jgi:hypothetical protein
MPSFLAAIFLRKFTAGNTFRGIDAIHPLAAVVAATQTCYENAEQLRALQVWIREMASAIK